MDIEKFLSLGEQEQTDWITDLFEKDGDSSVCHLFESIFKPRKIGQTKSLQDCLVLASQSPRRKYLISEVLGVNHVTKISPAQELLPGRKVSLPTLTKTIAVMKVLPLVLSGTLEGSVILGSDTLIRKENGEWVGKASGDSLEERLIRAMDILEGLLGKSHTVSTSMAVYDTVQNKLHIAQDSVEIEFYSSTPQIMDRLKEYIDLSRRQISGRGPEGKAGCYGLQEPEIVSITRRISGDPLVAMGLSLSQAKGLLALCGLKTREYVEEEVYEAIWGSSAAQVRRKRVKTLTIVN